MRKKRNYLFCISVFVVLFASVFYITTFAEETPISVVFDGQVIDFGTEQPPVLSNSGQVLVPLRKTTELLGANIDWVSQTGRITVSKSNITLELKVNDTVAKKNGVDILLDYPAVIMNSRTMVPIKFVSDVFGVTIEWKADTKQVIINSSSNWKGSALKVLAVGNSFSQDAEKYIHDIGVADGVNITVYNLYIGGCSLKTHWENASNDKVAYDYQPSGIGFGKKVSIKEALLMEDWDIITMQQVSNDSGVESSYSPYIEDLAKYIKELEPKAKLYLHQTWAYEKGSTHVAFPTYNKDQSIMFNGIKAASNNVAAKVGMLTLENGQELSEGKVPLRIIPCGQAVQNARANTIFDTTFKDGKLIRLNRDGSHASMTYGRYLLAAVWYECLTGNAIEKNSYHPTGVEDNELALLKKAAHDAVTEYKWEVK